MALSPYRASLDATLACVDMADASRRWNALMYAAERLGFNVELGAVGVMDEADVLEGSALAGALGLGEVG